MKRKYSGLLLGMVVMLTACGQEPAQNTGEIGQNGGWHTGNGVLSEKDGYGRA